MPNTKALATMDYVTYISGEKSFVNYMNCSMYTGDSEDAIVGGFKRMLHVFPKFKYKIKEIAGDFYYEEMSEEETIKKMFLGPESPDKVLKN